MFLETKGEHFESLQVQYTDKHFGNPVNGTLTEVLSFA